MAKRFQVPQGDGQEAVEVKASDRADRGLASIFGKEREVLARRDKELKGLVTKEPDIILA